MNCSPITMFSDSNSVSISRLPHALYMYVFSFVFYCLLHAKGPACLRFRNSVKFINIPDMNTQGLLGPCPISKMEDRPLSTVHDCSVDTFAVILYNLRLTSPSAT